MRPLLRPIHPLAILLLMASCSPKPNIEVPQAYKAGQNHFHKVCASCHGADALGNCQGGQRPVGNAHRKYEQEILFSYADHSGNFQVFVFSEMPNFPFSEGLKPLSLWEHTQCARPG